MLVHSTAHIAQVSWVQCVHICPDACTVDCTVYIVHLWLARARHAQLHSLVFLLKVRHPGSIRSASPQSYHQRSGQSIGQRYVSRRPWHKGHSHTQHMSRRCTQQMLMAQWHAAALQARHCKRSTASIPAQFSQQAIATVNCLIYETTSWHISTHLALHTHLPNDVVLIQLALELLNVPAPATQLMGHRRWSCIEQRPF